MFSWIITYKMHIINNEPCLARSTLVDLSPDKLSQTVRHYPFMINLNKFNGSCNTLDDRPNKICVLNKTEDVK